MDERAHLGTKLGHGSTLEQLETFVEQLRDPDRQDKDPLDLVSCLAAAAGYEEKNEPGLFGCGLLRIVYILLTLHFDKSAKKSARLSSALDAFETTLTKLFSKTVPEFTCHCSRISSPERLAKRFLFTC